MNSKRQSKKRLTASTLKDELWESLKRVNRGEQSPEAASAIAREAEAITNVVRSQLKIAQADKDGLLGVAAKLKNYASQ